VFHHALEDEELLHFLIALAHQRIAFAVVGDREQRLELGPLRDAHPLEPLVLPQQQPEAVALWMRAECRHRAAHSSPLTSVKAARTRRFLP
jgi:hypothetical protein